MIRHALFAAAAGALVASAAAVPAQASPADWFNPGDLLLSRTVYTASPGSIVPGQTLLPAGCTSDCVTAVADGGYPEVFNNESVDPSFGVSSPIYLDRLTTAGRTVGSMRVPAPNGWQSGLVTSFPSKSELGLSVSTGGDAVSFMGYVAPQNSVDVSNSNTPIAPDPTNPVGTADYRAVATLRGGFLTYTETNAYSGNNGRAAVLDDRSGLLYTAGNAGNGGNPEPADVVAGAGAQVMHESWLPEVLQHPGVPTPAGVFSVTQLGDPADKVGKDTNFRGLTIHDNVEYVTKGSGGNGVNTVYFVDTTGRACPSGAGLPLAGAPLPTPSAVSAMCVLKGFPTALKSKTSFPFGLWFANSTTLYVTDEGDGTATYDPASGTYTAAAASGTAGLQKWVLTGGQWQLAYTISAGLNLGTPYPVAHYLSGVNAATGLPWALATDGLRTLTGRVNRDGTVTIWAVTSTVSGATDTGADPNRLVAVTDRVGATSAGGDSFVTLRTAQSGEALRGVTLLSQSDRF